MKEMIVVSYDDQYSARKALSELRRLNYRWVTEIADAVAVARDTEGKLHVQDSYQLTSQDGRSWGVVWGMLFGSLGLMLAPFTGGLSAAAAAGVVAAGAVAGAALGGLAGATAAHNYKEDFGLPEEFVAEVSTQVMPGGSAIFALVDSYDADPRPEYMASYFRGTGGTIIRTTLTPQQEERVQQVLKGEA